MGCTPSTSKNMATLVPYGPVFEPRKPERGLDKDHWFEINLSNERLFPHISLRGLPNLLPGRLFSTRMPRDLAENLGARTAFERKVKQHKLDIVLILTEKEEYEEYAKVDLEEFYHSLGLQILCFPIKDFDTPSPEEFTEMVKLATINLADKKNILVHCAGGNGRTGLLLCGILKTCGVANPIQVARKTKSTYVETPEQEKMVKDFPVIVPVADELCAKQPGLAKIISLDKLLSEAKLQEKLAASQRRLERRRKLRSKWKINYGDESMERDTKRPRRRTRRKTAPQPQPRPTQEEAEPQHEEQSRSLAHAKKYPSTQYRNAKKVFDLLDRNQDGRLSMNELQHAFQGLGARVNMRDLLRLIDAYGTQDETNPDRVTIEFEQFAHVFLP